MASQPSSRASSRCGRSPMPAPSGQGVTLNRPLGLSSGQTGFSTLPRSAGRDYSCPPPSRSAFSNRRSSSGIFISSMFGSRFRHLQKLHSDAFMLGLNAVCFPGLPVGTMFRSSLPATPVSTPIHREMFSHFTEQALRERLSQTPSPRKAGLRFSPLDTDPALSLQEDAAERLSNSSDNGQAMDITPCITPIEET